jgi:predicted translin family RNA/ssDNA-binding protein
MSQTLPAGDVFVFQFPWFLQVAQQRVLAGITDFAGEIDRYLKENYGKIDMVGTTEILKKK